MECGTLVVGVVLLFFFGNGGEALASASIDACGYFIILFHKD
jgi:hypothetical protein